MADGIDPAGLPMSPLGDNVRSLPEELVPSILQHLASPDLLACAKISRYFNRLAVLYALEQLGIWHPSDACHLELAYMEIDVLSFLLVSAHLKSFNKLTVNFSPSRFFGYHLHRFVAFLEKTESLSVVALHFKTFEVDRQDPYTDGHVRGLFEKALNTIISKPCDCIRLEDWSKGIIPGFKLDTKQGDIMASNSIKDDELQYANTRLGTFRTSQEYNPSIPSEVTNFLAMSQFLRPPFSSWVFSLLKQHTPDHLTLSFDIALSDQEHRFMMHRLATAAPTCTSLFVGVYLRSTFIGLVSAINYFSQSLSRLILQAYFTKVPSEGLSLDLPLLQYIRATPGVLRALFAAGSQHNLPKLRLLDVVAVVRHTYEHFGVEEFSEALADIRRLTAAWQEVTLKNSNTTTPDQFRIDVHIDFRDADFGALEPYFEDSEKLELGPEHIEALAVVGSAVLLLSGTPFEAQQGVYKKHLLAFLTVFPQLKRLSIHCRYSKPMELDPSLFAALQLHCPSLETAHIC